MDLYNFLIKRIVPEKEGNLCILGGPYTTTYYKIKEYEEFYKLYAENYHEHMCFHQIAKENSKLFFDIDEELDEEKLKLLTDYIETNLSTDYHVLKKFDPIKKLWINRYHIYINLYFTIQECRKIILKISSIFNIKIDYYPLMSFYIRMPGSIKRITTNDKCVYLSNENINIDIIKKCSIW